MNQQRIRTGVLALVFVVAACVLLQRAWALQVRDHKRYLKMARSQQERALTLHPKRGMVTDRDGLPLAVSVNTESVYLNVKEMNEQGVSGDVVAAQLSSLFGKDQATLLERMKPSKNGKPKQFVWIARGPTPDSIEQAKKTGWSFLHFVQESKRFYPNRTLAAHVLGFVNVDGEGVEGIELSMNEKLRGKQNKVPAIRDRQGRVVFSEGLMEQTTGSEVKLTLDRSIQTIVERELELAVRTYEAASGTVVVLRPKTGEVLGIASYPTYNPNTPQESQISDRRHRAISDLFEPGSTVKPVTLGLALSRGLVSSNSPFDCEHGSFVVTDGTIHDSHPYGVLSVNEILSKSSNIGVTKIAFMLGKSGLYRGFRRFGFGEKTGIELPGESAGILRHETGWYDFDLATIGFGQGMSVNTLQLASAMGAFANGGVLMKPYIIAGVDGVETEPVSVRRVLPAWANQAMKQMMRQVVLDGGTGVLAASSEYEVAGKTGTAQKADYEHGGYAPGKWISSFVGFAPYDHPEITVAVIIDEPHFAHYGGEVAGPVFRTIVEQSLHRMLVTPQGDTGLKQVAPLARTRRHQARDEARQQAVGGEGKDPETDLPSESVPNFVGLTMRQALRLAKQKNIHIEVHGAGHIASQFPNAGELISSYDRVSLELQMTP